MTMSTRPAIFITGAAAGIGRAVAERFAQADWFVGWYDLHEPAVHGLHRQHSADHGISGRLDVSQAADWSRAIDSFAQASGQRLDVLFNNAGISLTRPFVKGDLARHHQVVDVNLKGVINGCHTAHALLKATPDSRVINMCSASALYGQPELACYSATKSAVRALTEALDIEWRREGIRVVDVLPLFVNTAMVRDDVSHMKTVGTLGVHLGPEDIAQAVWRLAQQPARRMPVHTFVGVQTRLFALLSKLSPGWVNGWVTAKMAGY
jgi:NAD(P)-dependent dehydrogenase (short-subunit alcohol dehydrogenase family)